MYYVTEPWSHRKFHFWVCEKKINVLKRAEFHLMAYNRIYFFYMAKRDTFSEDHSLRRRLGLFSQLVTFPCSDFNWRPNGKAFIASSVWNNLFRPSRAAISWAISMFSPAPAQMEKYTK